MAHDPEAIDRGARALYARMKQPGGEVSELGATIMATWDELPRPVKHLYRCHALAVLDAASNTP